MKDGLGEARALLEMLWERRQGQNARQRRPYAHGAFLLLLIRDRVVDDIDSLRRFFGITRDSLTAYYELDAAIAALHRAGLIAVEKTPGEQDDNAILRVAGNWASIQTALGLSLVEVLSLSSDDSMEVRKVPRGSFVVRPMFGLPERDSDHPDVLVLMPFAQDFRCIYDEYFLPVASELQLSMSRVDDFLGPGNVITDIWSAICKARAIIADCTGQNANVFYEVGVAHTVGKDVVLVSQSEDDIPFDLRHLRYLIYGATRPGLGAFQIALLHTLRKLLSLDYPTFP